MPINYLAVLVCGVISMLVGYVWYGPLFGKKWMHITGANAKSAEERKKMQKEAGPLYLVQFLLTLFQVYILAYLIACWPGASGWQLSLFLWAGFVMPIVAGSAMWNNDSSKVSWARFLIQAGYQLVMFVVYGLILTAWL